MFEVGDLLQRTKPFPDEKEQLWIVVSIEEENNIVFENDIRPVFISVMNCTNQRTSTFIYNIVKDNFNKVE